MRLLLTALAAASCATVSPADLVVLNGKVLTVDPVFRVAQAVAIRGGVFVRVGDDAEVRALVGPATRVIDAGGQTVLPGLIDSHVHAANVARIEAVEPQPTFASIAEMQDWLRGKAARAPEGTWIKVPRSYPSRMREGRFPTRVELDAAAPRHPVYVDGAYAQILNSAALKAAGITRDTPAPIGREIVKDERGEPTGLLRNMAAAVGKFIHGSEVSQEAWLQALEQVHRRYNEVGITSIVERAGSPETYALYQSLRGRGRLRVRTTVTVMVNADGTAEGTEAFIRGLPFHFREGDDWLRVGPLKILVDGGILVGTAYMRAPYGTAGAKLFAITDEHYRGTLSLTPEKVKAIIRAGHRLGWQMASHVTGDGGVDLVLDAVQAANADAPIGKNRYTLIHAYFPNAEAVRRAAALGVVVDTQPAWFYKDGDAIASAMGDERLQSFIGLKDWLAAGIPVAINTDHMYGVDPDKATNPFNPFLTMYVATTRKTESGRVLGPAQRVSREEALRMMTITAAYLSFDETTRGSIEVGKLGDLTVLAGDFLTCSEEQLRKMRVRVTVVGGQVVYETHGPS